MKSRYKDQRWIRKRKAILSRDGYRCQISARYGKNVPADTVHHIVHLTPQNITDPTISLSTSNLMAVCRDCHAELHKGRKRYKIDKFGRVTAV